MPTVRPLIGEAMNDDIVFLTKEQAIAMLPDGDYIHTFRGFVGADWSRNEIMGAIEKYQFELTGPNATAMNHGMGFRDEHGWVFVSTRPNNALNTDALRSASRAG